MKLQTVSLLLFTLIFIFQFKAFAQQTCDTSAFEKALAFHQNKNYDSAIIVYSEVIKQCPSFQNAYLNRSFCYYYIGDEKKSFEDYQVALNTTDDKLTTMNTYAGFFLHLEQFQKLLNFLKKYWLSIHSMRKLITEWDVAFGWRA